MRPTYSADEMQPATCTTVEWMDDPFDDSAGGSTSRSTLFTAG